MRLIGTSTEKGENVSDSLEHVGIGLGWRSAMRYYLRLSALRVFERVSAGPSFHGDLFAIPGEHISNRIAAFGTYAPFEILALKMLIASREPMINSEVMLDIGANIGNHTLSLARYFRAIHAFEVNPEVQAILKHNTRHLLNCHVHSFGASDEDCVMELCIDPQNLGRSSIVENVSADTRSVQLRRLDNFDEIRKMKVGFIKLDVEGHEKKALTGMVEILTEQRPIVGFELNAEQVKNFRSETIDFLADIGYSNFAALSLYPDKGRFLIGILRRLIFGLEIRFVKLDIANIPKKNKALVIAY